MSTPRTVNDVMSRTVVAVGRHASHTEIAELMREWDITMIPVVEGEGRVVGVATATAVTLERVRPVPAGPTQGSGAEDFLSGPPRTVRPHTALAEAARLMVRDRTDHLPVVNGYGLLEGVVSRDSIPITFFRSDAEIADEIRSTVLQRFPAPSDTEVTVTDGVVTVRDLPQDGAMGPRLIWAIRVVDGVVRVRAGHKGKPRTDLASPNNVS
ncbi:HPP family protein [Streptomyces sp. NPDC056069]|uniref:CBS domain-containing protein n=1 Tax=Streptomyces sp. NPDC056069 TaxID=3345702 RepID=UPI0035DA8972